MTCTCFITCIPGSNTTRRLSTKHFRIVKLRLLSCKVISGMVTTWENNTKDDEETNDGTNQGGTYRLQQTNEMP